MLFLASCLNCLKEFTPISNLKRDESPEDTPCSCRGTPWLARGLGRWCRLWEWPVGWGVEMLWGFHLGETVWAFYWWWCQAPASVLSLPGFCGCAELWAALHAASSQQCMVLSCRHPLPVSEGLPAPLNTLMQSRELSLKLPSVHNKTSSLAEFDQFSDYYWESMVSPSPPAVPPWKASCLNVKGCSHFLCGFYLILLQ